MQCIAPAWEHIQGELILSLFLNRKSNVRMSMSMLLLTDVLDKKLFEIPIFAYVARWHWSVLLKIHSITDTVSEMFGISFGVEDCFLTKKQQLLSWNTLIRINVVYILVPPSWKTSSFNSVNFYSETACICNVLDCEMCNSWVSNNNLFSPWYILFTLIKNISKFPNALFWSIKPESLRWFQNIQDQGFKISSSS